MTADRRELFLRPDADNHRSDSLDALLEVLAEIAISATERQRDGEGELRVAS